MTPCSGTIRISDCRPPALPVALSIDREEHRIVGSPRTLAIHASASAAPVGRMVEQIGEALAAPSGTVGGREEVGGVLRADRLEPRVAAVEDDAAAAALAGCGALMRVPFADGVETLAIGRIEQLDAERRLDRA